MPFDDTVFLKKQVDVLSYFSEEQLRMVTSEIERNIYKTGQTIMFQGEVTKNFYIIKRGKAEAFAKTDGQKFALGELKAGDFFGEISLLESSSAIATVKAVEDETEVLMLTHESFQHLLKTIPAIEKILRDKIQERRKQKSDAVDKKPGS